MGRIQFLISSWAAHFFLYLIPRWWNMLTARLPVTVWELLTGKRPLSSSATRERRIHVVTTQKSPAIAEKLLKRLGLTENMQYTAPLYSGDVHTILGGMRPSHRVSFERELLEAADGNPICIDWLRLPQGRQAKGVSLVVPGIGNYAQTPYMQRLARRLQRDGFHVCVYTPRGMGSAPLTKPRLTCITFTDDVRQVMRQRLQKDQVLTRFGEDLPVGVIGFSAGGLTLAKALVEEVAAAKADPHLYPHGFPIKFCVCMNSPYNMFVHTETVIHSNHMYQKALVDSMRRYTKKHLDVVVRDGLPGLPHLKTREQFVEYFDSLCHVEDYNERFVAPHFGYKNGSGYYEDAAGFKWLPQLDPSITCVCVASRDDPLVGYGHTREEWQAVVDAHPNVVYVETPVGGHLAYVDSPWQEMQRNGRGFLWDFPTSITRNFFAAEKAKDR